MAQPRRRKYHELIGTKHIVYRCLGRDGELLYVGVTRAFGLRFEQHISQRPWWTDVSTILLKHYPNGIDARVAEAQAIRVEHPRHNICAPDVLALFEAARPIRPKRPAGQATTCPKCGVPKERPRAPYCKACFKIYQKNRRAR